MNKKALEGLRSPFKKIQQHSRTKHLRIITPTEQEKQLHFARSIPSPRLAVLGSRREFPATRVPLTRKGEKDE